MPPDNPFKTGNVTQQMQAYKANPRDFGIAVKKPEQPAKNGWQK